MYTNEQLVKVSSELAERIDRVTEGVLIKLAKRLRKLGTLEASDVREIDKLRNIGADINIITAELSRVTGKTINEVNALYEALATDAYKDSAIFYAARGIQQLPFEDNAAMLGIVQAQEAITAGTFRNMADSTAFRLRDHNGVPHYKPLREAYTQAIDDAILAKQQGFKSWHTAVRDVLQPLINSGVRTVEYDSGYSRNIYSAARMNIMDGARQLNNDIRMQAGAEFGANGYEISVHTMCAPDHVHIQGKQYSTEAYNRLNEELKRPIGTLNCQHHIFPVILGVSATAYNDAELAEITRLNTDKSVVINGKEYTPYEASQLQRRLENKVRKLEMTARVYDAAGDTEAATNARNRVRETKKIYRDISKQAKIKTHFDRMSLPTAPKAG
jgi:hypothetical protein